MTEDQRYYRSRSRQETTQVRKNLDEMDSWVYLNTNRANFFSLAASIHAKNAASLAFKAHPDLREDEVGREL
jgi:hypothetical protein